MFVERRGSLLGFGAGPASQLGISASSAARIFDLGLLNVVVVGEVDRSRAFEGELGGLRRQRVADSFVSLSAFVTISLQGLTSTSPPYWPCSKDPSRSHMQRLRALNHKAGGGSSE